jgi:hypothetical protein
MLLHANTHGNFTSMAFVWAAPVAYLACSHTTPELDYHRVWHLLMVEFTHGPRPCDVVPRREDQLRSDQAPRPSRAASVSGFSVSTSCASAGGLGGKVRDLPIAARATLAEATILLPGYYLVWIYKYLVAV